MMSARTPESSSSESAARFLAEASQTLARSFDLAVTLPRAAQLAASYLADACIIEYVDQDGRRHAPAVAGRIGDAVDEIRAHLGAISRDPDDQSLVLDSLPTSFWHDCGLRAPVIEPIEISGTRVGAIALAQARGSEQRAGVDRELLREVGVRLATAMHNAHRFMRERRVARSFQTALLPTTFPTLTGRRFHASYAPATDEAEVGGDWYDAFDLPDGRIAMSIGDVAGHGLEAAVVMGEVRQTFRVAAMENKDPGAVLDMANRLLLLRADPIMVTAIFGTYDGKTFTYASAGHPPPILASVEGRADVLPISGIPLGVEGSHGRTSWSVTIPPASMLVLYTDGLIELGRDVLDGEKLLLDAVKAEMSQTNDDPARSIRERVLGVRRNLDDVAVLTFTVDEAPMPELDLFYTAAPVAARLVRHSISRFAHDSGLTGEQEFELNVAIGEAVNNVIEHAYLRTSGLFSVKVRKTGDKIQCSIHDSGAWRRARREGRGHGLPIIRSLMQSVEVNLSQKGTVISMVYDVSGTGEESQKSSAAGNR